MDFKALLKRLGTILLCTLVCLGFLTAAMLNKREIAAWLAPDFAPLAQAEALAQGTAASRTCRSEPAWGRFSGECDRDWTGWAQAQHRYEYNHRIDDMADTVNDWLERALTTTLAVAALATLWALWQFFAAHGLPAMKRGLGGVTETAWESLDVEGRVKSRRFRKAEQDFQTLKSLRDNGLINEAAFLERKRELANSLRPRD